MRDDEFERLFDENAAGLVNFLALRVHDRAIAEDLAADAFERALRGRARFDRRRGNERTWLYAIALNLLRDHDRRRRVAERAADLPRPLSFPSPEATTAERDEVVRALSELSEEERQVIALRYGADLSLSEIAQVIQEPLTTVEGRVYRALRKLRSVLSPGRETSRR